MHRRLSGQHRGEGDRLFTDPRNDLFIIRIGIPSGDFRTAQVFIESYYQLTLFVLIGTLFFGIMVSIFLFTTIKGISFFIKSKEKEKKQPEKIQNTVIREEPVVQKTKSGSKIRM